MALLGPCSAAGMVLAEGAGAALIADGSLFEDLAIG
jgi:hypothetical protein